MDLYPDFRKDPAKKYLSNISPYLHFGQISPLYIAQRVLDTVSSGAESFLEELVIRRERSMNHIHYNPLYDSYNGLPEWTKKTLNKHQKDRGEYLYSLNVLENVETFDPY